MSVRKFLFILGIVLSIIAVIMPFVTDCGIMYYIIYIPLTWLFGDLAIGLPILGVANLLYLLKLEKQAMFFRLSWICPLLLIPACGLMTLSECSGGSMGWLASQLRYMFDVSGSGFVLSCIEFFILLYYVSLCTKKPKKSKSEAKEEMPEPSKVVTWFKQCFVPEDDESVNVHSNRIADRLVKAYLEHGISLTTIETVEGKPFDTCYVKKPSSVTVAYLRKFSEDIALQLGVKAITINPAPQKHGVAIEIPNGKTVKAELMRLLDMEEFKKSKYEIPIPIGISARGELIIRDLTKAKHLMVAGSTGSGKSVCLNSLISSIIAKLTANDVRLLLIDGKNGIEFNSFEGVPHLLSEVVTTAEKAKTALIWLVKEMEKRNAHLTQHGVKDLKAYNRKSNDKIPWIVVVIDEFAEIIKRDSEIPGIVESIARQGRSAGVVLIWGSQSVKADTIDKDIKDNMLSVIALKTQNGYQSRTIMASEATQNLNGKGDMLVKWDTDAEATRCQGAYISDEHIDGIVAVAKERDTETKYAIDLDNEKVEVIKSEPVVDEYELVKEYVIFTGDATYRGIKENCIIDGERKIHETSIKKYLDAMVDEGIITKPEGEKKKRRILIGDHAAVFQ